MIRYLVGRLLQVAPVLLGISIIVFLLVRLIPGDPAIALLGSRATPELVARVHDQLGLDLPIWQQYLTYIGNALQGDFGISFFYQAPVWEVTVERFPLTIMLMAYSLLLASAIGIPFAVLSALHRGGPVDQAVRLAFTATLGMPSFWLGIVLALLLGVRLRLFPISGSGDGGLDTLWHLTLPALTIALAIAPIIVRTLRSSLIEVIESDYVMTARAMGVERRFLLASYLLRNSLRPVVTILAINVGILIGGTVIIEEIFSLPGMGSLLIGSITRRDYAVIQLATLIFALLVVVVNLIADLAYAVLDPRISLGR
jgi:peptide/nickel transport system permease protein